MTEDILTTGLENGVFTIAFNRPNSMNAMTTAVGNRLADAVRLAARDPAVRLVILTGAGRAFSAGGDIKNLGQPDPLDPLAVKYGDDPIWNAPELRHQRLVESAQVFYQLHSMPKTTVAMVNGPAIGAGMTAALACDFRIMSDEAHFNCAYASMGLSGDIGSAYFLTAVVGAAKAREIMFFPRRIDAHEALRLGLATRVVPHEDLQDETLAFARQLADGPTLTLGHIKENLVAAQALDAHAAFDIEARNFLRCFQTEDHKEAVAAFKDKRAPIFRGR